MRLSEIWGRLVSVLYPERCVLCGDVVEYDSLWCERCECPRTKRIRQGEGKLDAVVVPLSYEGPIREAVLHIKKVPDPRTAAFFAEQMGELIPWREWAVDWIVPVPTSPEKRAERGYNQAELLAHRLADARRLPVCADALCRRNDSREQHRLTARERMENAARSYTAGPDLEGLRGAKVLVVDDVYTTGATMGACATLLRGAGACCVYGVAAAYTPGYPEKTE